MKNSVVNARIEPALKMQAETVLQNIGLSSSEAIRIFYRHICLHNGLPFTPRIPNAETLAAMKDADEGRTFKVDSVSDMFASFMDEDDEEGR